MYLILATEEHPDSQMLPLRQPIANYITLQYPIQFVTVLINNNRFGEEDDTNIGSSGGSSSE